MFRYLKNTDVLITMIKFDFKLRYRGTALGVIWSLLAPFLLAIILFLVFKNIFSWFENFASYVLVGVFVFRFFQIASSVGMNSIVDKANIVTKTNIERETIPLSITFSYGISSFLEIIVVIPIVCILGGKIGASIMFLPILHFVYIVFLFGLNLILSSMMVYFRDLNQIWELLTNIFFFISPVVYPLQTIPENYRDLYMLNPLTCILEIYRGIIINDFFPFERFLYLLCVTLLVLLAGQLIFKRLQRRFGEVL